MKRDASSFDRSHYQRTSYLQPRYAMRTRLQHANVYKLLSVIIHYSLQYLFAIFIAAMSVATDVLKSLRSPVGREILDFTLGCIWKMGFARSLGMNERAHITSLHPLGKSLEAVFTVPEKLCLTEGTLGKGGDSFLPCGVTTAIFDEISTLCMILADRKFRPGVSISLSCHMFDPVSPGESVTFKCRALKSGSRIGFGEASVYREDGKLAAKARHVKYLPMGHVWDFSMQPFLFPLSAKLARLQHDKMLKDPERTKDIPAGEHLLDMFKLEDLPQFEEREAAEDHLGDTDLVPVEELEDSRSADAKMLVTKRQLNYMPGGFHGGAIAVAAEEMARRCPPSNLHLNKEIPGNPMIKFMELHYMSPIKGGARLSAASAGSRGKTVTRVGLSETCAGPGKDVMGGGVLCAEAVLEWGGRL